MLLESNTGKWHKKKLHCFSFGPQNGTMQLSTNPPIALLELIQLEHVGTKTKGKQGWSEKQKVLTCEHQKIPLKSKGLRVFGISQGFLMSTVGG